MKIDKKDLIFKIILLLVIIVTLIINYKPNKKEIIKDDVKYTLTSLVSINYDEVLFEYNDMILVKKDNKYGLIDLDGNEVIDTIYADYEIHIDSDLILLKKNNIYYVFNMNGKELFKSKYELSFVNNYDLDKCFILEKISKNKFKLYDEEFEVLYDGKYLKENIEIIDNKIVSDHLYDLSTKKVEKIDYGYLLTDTLYYVKGKTNKIFNLKTSTWKTYDEVNLIESEYYFKLVKGKDIKYINYDNKEIKKEDINKEYLTDDIYMINSCDKYKTLMKGNKYLIDGCYEYFDVSLADKGIYIAIKDGKSYVKFPNGSIKEYDAEVFTTGDYIVIMPLPGVIKGLIDLEGNELDYSPCKNHLTYIKDDEYVCSVNDYSEFIIDKNGNRLTEVYESILCDEEGICSIKDKDGHYGIYYDKEVIVNPVYHSLNWLDSGLYVAKQLNGYDLLAFNEGLKIIHNFNYEKDYIVDVYSTIEKYNLSYKDYIAKDLGFFKKFAYIVLNNKKIGNYTKEVLDLYPIVFNNKYYIDETTFFDSLSNLEIKKVKKFDDDRVAGYYYSGTNKIEMVDDSRRVIYHELIHFLDYKFNEEKLYTEYMCNGEVYSLNRITSLPNDEIKKCDILTVYSDTNLITEAGAEVNMGKYFYNGVTTTYTEIVNIYKILEYLFGEEEINSEVLFNSYGSYNLYKLLTEKGGLTYIEYNRFITISEKMSDIGYVRKDSDFISIADLLVKMYNNLNDNDSKEFNYLLSLFLNFVDLDKKNINYNYYKSLPNIFGLENKVNNGLNNKHSVYGISSIIKDGKVLITGYVSEGTATIIIDYDFENDKINDYEVYVF